jgi:DNA/RNA endonuclease G (NUC1)
MSKLTRAFGLVLLGLALSQPARAAVCENDNFSPTPENDAKTCRAVWEKIGLPVSGDDIDATIVCHTRYVLLHNNENKTPDWVIEPLTSKQVSGKFTRPEGKKFSSEEFVCPSARAKDKDYGGSKLDRGHQAASADFSSDGDLMDESFILSNAVPQQGLGFNRGIWKEFEQLVRKLTKDRGELYVITGPIYPDADGNVPDITKKNNACQNEIKFQAPKKAAICDENDKNPKAKCDAGVAVPVGLFKIFYDPGSKRANAYVLPNIDHRPFEEKDALEYLKGFRTTVKVVERFTGFQFLPDIPGRKAQVEECVATMLH